jgi:thiol-disulfide isomerase/thioredoxin
LEIDKLIAASYPAYRVLSASDMRAPEQIVFAFVSPTLTSAHQDFLFEIGTRFPRVCVGWAGEDVVPYIEQVLGDKPATPDVVVFNFDKMIHYNTSEFFTKSLLEAPFFVDQWISASARMLSQIESGELNPIFVSEEEPAEQPNLVQKIVGTSYPEFVLDDSKDVVVLYKRQDCPHCEEFLPVLEAFAYECREAGLDFLKFGHIDVTKNSAVIGFPYMPGVPHCYIFPANNKTGGDCLRGGRDRDGLIRWLKRFASQAIPFESGPLDKAKGAMEVFQMLMTMKDMPEGEQMKAMAYMEEMTALLDKDKQNSMNEPAADEL